MSTWGGTIWSGSIWGGILSRGGSGGGTGPISTVRLTGDLDWTVNLLSRWNCKTNMSKPTEENIIGYVSGDPLAFAFTTTEWPTDRTVEKAYLTIKNKPSDLDVNAIVQKVVTTSASSSGQITATGSGGRIDGSIIVSKTESALLTPGKRYVYDIRVIANDAFPFTVFMGRIRMVDGVTDANS